MLVCSRVFKILSKENKFKFYINIFVSTFLKYMQHIHLSEGFSVRYTARYFDLNCKY